MTFYDYSLIDRTGNEVSMRNYEGKVVIVVNTATGCGFTPQYKDLEDMYEKYHEQGLEIIDVPCNQFANQTPGTDEEVHEFCTLKYNTQFDQFKKSDVNGEHALPLFTFLKKKQGFNGFGNGVKALGMRAMCKLKDSNYKSNPDIKWNFTKFVIDRNGNVVRRFEPTEDMHLVETCIQSLL